MRRRGGTAGVACVECERTRAEAVGETDVDLCRTPPEGVSPPGDLKQTLVRSGEPVATSICRVREMSKVGVSPGLIAANGTSEAHRQPRQL